MIGFDEVSLEPGQELFKAGDAATKLYVIQSGAIEMRDAKSGAVFATLREGESFGEQAMLFGGIRSASAVAAQASKCLEITADSMRELLRQQSPILTSALEALMLQQSMHNALRAKD